MWERHSCRDRGKNAPPTVYIKCPMALLRFDQVSLEFGEQLILRDADLVLEPGEVVRVIDGPFNDFSGVVESVNYEKSKLQVAVQILGRATPVELDFGQVEKG